MQTTDLEDSNPHLTETESPSEQCALWHLILCIPFGSPKLALLQLTALLLAGFTVCVIAHENIFLGEVTTTGHVPKLATGALAPGFTGVTSHAIVAIITTIIGVESHATYS